MHNNFSFHITTNGYRIRRNKEKKFECSYYVHVQSKRSPTSTFSIFFLFSFGSCFVYVVSANWTILGTIFILFLHFYGKKILQIKNRLVYIIVNDIYPSFNKSGYNHTDSCSVMEEEKIEKTAFLCIKLNKLN